MSPCFCQITLARRRCPATPAGRGAGITAASPGGRPARRAAERRRPARAFSGREAGNPGAHREQYGRAGRRERTGGMHRTGPEPTEGVSQRMERVLQGRRVRLRPLRKEDLPRRLEMINDPQVQELWIGVPADKNTLDDVEMWWYLLQEGPPSEQWAIETEDGRYVGDIDFHSIDEARKEAWFTPMFGEKSLFDEEYRRDILETFLRYAIEEKGMRRLSIQIADSDEVGVRLLQELGFRIVDRMEFDILEGVDELTMELDAEDFTARGARNNE